MKKIYLVCFVLFGMFFSLQATPVFSAGAVCNASGISGICEKPCTKGKTPKGVCTSMHGSLYVSNDYSCCITDTTAASTAQTTFTNPLTYDNLEALAINLMTGIQRTIVTFALVAMTVGALMYVLSSGNENTIERAKKTITAALIGLALAIAAPSILKELATVLGWTNITNATVVDSPSLTSVVTKILNFLLGIFGIMSLIMMIIGASLYLTSAGDEDRIKKGKDIFKYAILGVVIAMSAMVLVRQIAAFFVA